MTQQQPTLEIRQKHPHLQQWSAYAENEEGLTYKFHILRLENLWGGKVRFQAYVTGSHRNMQPLTLFEGKSKQDAFDACDRYMSEHITSD